MKIRVDVFTKNIFLVFTGSLLASLANLLCQLLIAHKFSPASFSAFNSIISIFTVVSVPLVTAQTAVAKYSAEFIASSQPAKANFIISAFFKRGLILAVSTWPVFYYLCLKIVYFLKVDSSLAALALSLLIASCWVVPVLLGASQGLELFGQYSAAIIAGSLLKLALVAIALAFNFHIAALLGSFLSANIFTIAVLALGLGLSALLRSRIQAVNLRPIIRYFLPVAFSLFFFTALVNMDMILARHIFSASVSGLYSISQMLGKVFLFLPMAISVVLLPRSSALKAKEADTRGVVYRSLIYAFILCSVSAIIYNIFPGFILKALTGKSFLISLNLGRLFCLSMSFFSFSYILITYFISIRDLRFLKYLGFSAVLQALAIIYFAKSIFAIQAVLCVNAVLLFLINIYIMHKTTRLSTG